MSQLSGITLNNYYTIILSTNSTNSNNVNVLEPFFYTFNMYLNETYIKGNIEKFPYLKASITHPNRSIEYFDGRTTPTWNYTPESTGLYTVKSVLDNQNLNLTFTANLQNLTIDYVGDTTGVYNKNITLKAKVTDMNNNALEGIKVIFRINGQVVGESYTDSNGIATLLYLSKSVDNLQVNVTTSTESYNNKSSNKTITITKAETKIVMDDFGGVFNKNTVLNATLVDDEGNPLSSYVVKFYVNGVFVGQSLTGVDGVAYFTYKCLVTGSLSVRAIFDGNENYLLSENSSSIAVVKAVTKIVIDDFGGVFNKVSVLNATLLDDDGNPLSGVLVKFYVNGVFVGQSLTGVDGVAYFTYKCLVTGSLSVRAIFDGNENYALSENSSNINVVLAGSKVSIGDFTGVFNKVSILNATLVDDKGNALSGYVVKFYVNGVFVGQSLTGVDGVAYFTYKCVVTGSLTVRATFVGDENYTSSENSSNIDVIKAESKVSTGNFTGVFNKDTVLNATLVDDEGNPLFEGVASFFSISSFSLAGYIIDFYVNGVYVGSNITNNEGIAYFNYCCNKAGQLTVNATFEGNENYVGSTINSLININKSNTKLFIDGPVIVNNNKTITYTIKLIDANDQPISNQKICIIIDGIKYSVVTDENGIVIVEHNFINEGKKLMLASYEGNDDYTSSLVEFSITVKPSAPEEDPDPDDNNSTNKTSKNPTAKAAVMKETGIPIIAILIILLSSLGLIFRKK